MSVSPSIPFPMIVNEDIIADRLAGLKVNPDCYLSWEEGQWEGEKNDFWAEIERCQYCDDYDRYGERQVVPYVVVRYYPFEDGWDGEENVSYHRTRKGAETQIAYLEDSGVPERYLHIEMYVTVWDDIRIED